MRERGLFIYETSNNRVQRLIALCALVLLVAAGVAVLVTNIHIGNDTPVGDRWYVRYVPDLVHDITPLRLLVVSALGTLLFVPIPVEVAFLFSVGQGHPLALCVAIAVLGVVLGNVVNYALGRKLSRYVLCVLSAKRFFEMRRQMNRWGPYAILVLGLMPIGSDILTFGLGTIRYNTHRLFAWIAVAALVKFTFLALAAGAVRGIFI